MSAIDLSPGALFARQFRIVRPLAKGGMGAVYVVEQMSTGRERALKLMHPMLVSDAKSVERFEREAQVGSRIESDHVVEVIAAGVEQAGPTPWICMELLKGETLADRLEKRGVPGRDEVLEILKQLAHALTAAHRAGIVHRDLKPENIFLAESRREGVPFTLKVLDFGVATLAQSATDVGGPKTTQGVGSPLWMAPEQTNVGKVVLATDVWALGLIAFQLLTGQSYWRTARTPGSTITALLVEIMVEALEPASARAREVAPHVALPPGFDDWFARCVARDPTQRFADATAAFPPLLALLSSLHQTQPELALGATAAAPLAAYAPQSGQTAPGALQDPRGPHGSSAPQPAVPAPASAAAMLAETQPGPQLASAPIALPTSAASASTAGTPATGAATSVPLPAPATAAPAPRRRLWPYVLLALFAIAAAFVIGIGYLAVLGSEEVARDLADAPPVSGHFVDPETGATIDLGPDGIHVRAPGSGATSPDTTAVALGPDGVQRETGEGTRTADDDAADDDAADDGAADDGAADDDAADDDAAEDDAADDDAAGTTRPSEAETDATRPERPARAPGLLGQVAEGMERRRARRDAREQPAEASTDPAAARSFRSHVIDPCWAATYEGETVPPRARYVVDVEGSAIRVQAPRDTTRQNDFIRCVVIHAPGQPAGHYVYTLP